jgi:4a-hydroxytetrahydrobiopterin dehydratase
MRWPGLAVSWRTSFLKGSFVAHRALERKEIESELAALNVAAAVPWSIVEGKLHKEFVFRDFVAAFGFMTQVALVAERTDHHPEWFNVYRTVRVDLTTHDVAGISAKDFALAKSMEAIAARSVRGA